jgi:hypothetical protein
MTNLELFYFTGKCLTLDEHPGFEKEIIEKCEEGHFNWQHFVGFCSDHLILPTIYLKFYAYGILEHLPKELSEHLKVIYELNIARNKQILIQLQHITKVLNSNNIYPVFLKGSGNLLDGVYSDIGERILGDIDFLVPEKDYLNAGRLFEEEGYSSGIQILPHIDITKSKHYPRLSHPDFVASIEVHRIPVNENYLSKYNSEVIDHEKKTVESLPGCFVLSEKHKTIHNFIHSQLSNSGHAYGIISFRDLYDLYLLSRRSELIETLPFIESQQKAIAYFVFAGEAFSLKGKFYPKSNFSARLLLQKHSLNLNSQVFYKIYRTAVYLKWQILNKYIGQFLKAFYSKSMRQSIARRLGNPHWYKTHWDWYKGFFTQKHN